MMYDIDDIVGRLQRRFGGGQNPELRKALYHRLAQLCVEHGAVAYYVVFETAADAAGKRDEGKFFSKIVLLRLIERGILKPREP